MKRRTLIKNLPLLATFPLLKSCGGTGTGLSSLLPQYIINTGMITEQLLPHFPFQKSFAGIGQINAINPRISMAPEINKVRVGLGIQTALSQGLGAMTGLPLLNSLAGTTQSGTCQFACGLRYDPDTRGIFLKEPEIEHLQLGNIPNYYTGQAKQLLNAFGPQIIDRYPVHTLEKSFASRILKNMTVTKNGISLGFGLI